VQPKPKETKEGKDAKDQKDGKEGKDTKDGKEHKDGKEDKDGIKDTPFAAEKTHPDVTPSPAEDAVSQDDGPKGPEPPVGRAFVTPTLRPTLGAGAFDPPEEEGR
jgi:hypothetical protein